MFKLKFSGKFYLGASLIILSFIIGMITHFTIILYFNHSTIRWISIIAYAISWPMLVIGAWWTGKEYVESIKKYFSYRFYSKSVKKGTKKAYGIAKKKTKDMENRARIKTTAFKNKTKDRTRKIRERYRNKTKQNVIETKTKRNF